MGDQAQGGASASIAETAGKPVVGVCWMLLTTLFFAAVNIIVHYQGDTVPLVQGVFIRMVCGLIFVLPGLIEILRTRYPRQVWGMFALRGGLQTAAMLLWFFAMSTTPMADVTAIGYLTPIIVTLGGALLLGERFSWRRGAAILVALLGALIILRPGLRAILPGHYAQLGAAVFFALSYLSVKKLTAWASASAIVATMTLVAAVVLAPYALATWTPVAPSLWLWLGLTAFFGTIAQVTMTKALASAPVSVTQPVLFTQLIWVAVAGLFLFGEPIDPWVILGGALILGSVVYVTLRAAAAKKRAAGQGQA